MEIIFCPDESRTSLPVLSKYYEQAFTRAEELFIATAFLTAWNSKTKLNPHCEKLRIVAGVDFGLTRKKACTELLNWLPAKYKGSFYAADRLKEGCFHPKILLWKEPDATFHCVAGSSNLTDAGFTDNYEINTYSRIIEKEYLRLVHWIESVAENHGSVISSDWISAYKESSYRRKPRRSGSGIIDLQLPTGRSVARWIVKRREQQDSFKEIRTRMMSLIQSCAEKDITDEAFYEKMYELWGRHNSRFMGSGFQIKGKRARWCDLCQSLLRILEAGSKVSTTRLDEIIRDEIDAVADDANPARGSWLSEMLCHFFPDKYPLLDNPVKEWLRFNKYRAPAGSTEGAKYIDLAVKLRNTLKQHEGKTTARNLAELDVAIWYWSQQKK